ncbi:hypothetical protein U062_02362 [Gammaproteobacteria bacterium MOLA455]|nr:hypothetical protein U062_02362 [Gammaproteobacteria bacterium MOLA455]
MKNLILALAITSLGVTMSSSLVAEQITLPIGEQTRQSELLLPARGMHKNTVLEDFGDPQEMTSAVGEPPISQWRYDGYVVYFEGNWVIQAVVKHPTQDDER